MKRILSLLLVLVLLVLGLLVLRLLVLTGSSLGLVFLYFLYLGVLLVLTAGALSSRAGLMSIGDLYCSLYLCGLSHKSKETAASKVDYFKINRVSAYLQIPYLLWCSFALYLNLGIYLLNR